jgi:hypothetical protein
MHAALLGCEAQLPDIFQNSPKGWLRSAAHGSICIQEGQPATNIDVSYKTWPFLTRGKSGNVGTERARVRTQNRTQSFDAQNRHSHLRHYIYAPCRTRTGNASLPAVMLTRCSPRQRKRAHPARRCFVVAAATGRSNRPWCRNHQPERCSHWSGRLRRAAGDRQRAGA